MKILMQTLTLAAVLYAGNSFGQKIKWESGDDMAFLKDQKVIAVEYDYSKITVKGEKPETYIASQKDELNKEKPGKGDNFEQEWKDAPTERYQPKFEKEFNYVLKEKDDSVIVKQGAEAKYTLIVVANDMDLGKGKTLSTRPALVNFTFMLVETADKSKVLAKGTLENVEGEVERPKGSNWIPGGNVSTAVTLKANVENHQFSNRIAVCYATAGTTLAKYIRKKIK